MNNPSLAQHSENLRFLHAPRFHGRSAPRQAGITSIGFIVLTVFIGLFAFGGMRLAPMYLNYMKVTGVLNGVFDEYDGKNPTRATLQISISRRFGVESVGVISSRDIKVIPESGGFLVVANYDHTAPFIGNLHFTVKFNKTVKIRH